MKNLPDRYKLCTIMDDTAFTISGDTAEYALHAHTDLYLIRAADDLGGHAWPLIQFHDSEHIGSECLELFIGSMDDGIGDNFT